MTLREWIKLSGKKVKEVAAEAGVSGAVVYQWISGTRIPTKENMQKLYTLSDGKIDANTFYK